MKYYLLILILFLGCSKPSSIVEIKELVIEVEEPFSLNMSSIVDTCFFVPIDSKSLIGEVSELEIGKEHLVLLDQAVSKKIIIIDWFGNVKATISDFGEGPGKYRIPRNLNLIEDQRKLVFYDDSGPKVMYYSLEGQFEKEVSISGLGQLNDLKFEGGKFWAYLRSGDFKRGDAIKYFDLDFSREIHALAPIDLMGWPSDHGIQHSIFRQLDSEKSYFQINSTPDLIEFDSDGLLNHFRIRFSQRGLDYSNKNINPYDFLHYSRAKEVIYLGPNHVDLGEFILLDLVDSGLGSMAILDKKKERGRKLSQLKNDLSLMMNFSGIPGSYINQPGYMVLVMPYGQFAAIREKLDWKGNSYQEIVWKVNSDDPESLVLLIYKLKSKMDISLD